MGKGAEENYLQDYLQHRSLRALRKLGSGTQGRVCEVVDNNGFIPLALKLHRMETPYQQELLCYRRLQELGIHSMAGFNIPQLLHADSNFRALELSIVAPPFILDFAQTTLDRPPDFSAAVWEEHLAKCELTYGEHWWRVDLALAQLRGQGIHYLDIHRGNIRL